MSRALRRLENLEQLARGLGGAADETVRLEVASCAAVDLISGCDHAGVTVNLDGELLTRAACDDMVRRANELQSRWDEGPCLDTLRTEETRRSDDLARDPRWPHWAPQVHDELGAGSLISLLLFTSKGSYGALSLYGDRPRAFDAEDVAAAQVLASHLSEAMALGREIHHRGLAIASRTSIGRAEGILMERFDITAEKAFDYLRRVSMDNNRKLVWVADDLVRTRRLPDEIGHPTGDPDLT